VNSGLITQIEYYPLKNQLYMAGTFTAVEGTTLNGLAYYDIAQNKWARLVPNGK
jgi:hypothetical protein